MNAWLRTPRQKFIAGFLFLMTALNGVLALVTYFEGTPIWSKVYAEAQFENESVSDALVGKFSLDEREVCEIKVQGLTLDQSWLWAKVLILDAKDRPIYSYDFNLSYYSGVEGGEDWSESNRAEEEIFVLPLGDYKIVVYGEDADPASGTASPSFHNGNMAADRDERIRVTLSKDIMLTRYFLILFLAFLLMTKFYSWRLQGHAKTEPPPGGGFYDFGDEVPPSSYSVHGSTSGGDYDPQEPPHRPGVGSDVDPIRES